MLRFNRSTKRSATVTAPLRRAVLETLEDRRLRTAVGDIVEMEWQGREIDSRWGW